LYYKILKIMIKAKTNNTYILIFYLLIFLSFSSLSFSQRKTIPFHLDERNRIILEYTIKGEKVNLFFDTGTSENFIDINFSDKVDFLPHKKNMKFTFKTISDITLNLIQPDSLYKTDCVFNGGWSLTDMNETRKLLNLGDNVNGIVGINYAFFKDVVEINFKNKKLYIWDSFPKKYLNHAKMLQVKIVRSDDGHKTKYSDLWSKYPYIKSSFTIADSIHLNPLFCLDTGCTPYAAIAVYDSLLFTTLMEHKKNITEKYGINYPTTRLQLPELGIDSSYVSISAIPPFHTDKEKSDIVGTKKIEGLLGMGFFIKYEIVLFDCMNKIGYFIKRE